jgi:hypothetical protein
MKFDYLLARSWEDAAVSALASRITKMDHFNEYIFAMRFASSARRKNIVLVYTPAAPAFYLMRRVCVKVAFEK